MRTLKNCTVRFALSGLLLTAAIAPSLAAPPQTPLVVSPNHRYLQYADGTPFFWQGDTGWLLFSRLDRAEAERYLEDRRIKGFNVIQVMVLHSPQMKTLDGAPALIEGNPGKPDTKAGGYWDHVDWVLDRAAEKGIFLAMVPSWGSLVKSKALNADNVVAYGTFLAERYKNKPNVIWLVGGDIDGEPNGDVWKQLGRTLKANDPQHLVTYHPIGRAQSSTWFHNEPWLDFNMFQSGHQRYDQDTKSPHKYGEDNWRYVLADLAREPLKPVIDGEPSYENIPQGLHDATQPRWTAADCRRYAYWSVFAGAFGHTYGDNGIMQFFKPGPAQGAYGNKTNWEQSMTDPGSGQMQFLKKLMLSRPYMERVPDQSLIAGENGTKYDYVIATRGASYLFAYSYTGKPFQVRLGVLTGTRLRGWWYSPSDGTSREIAEMPNKGAKEFVPPGEPKAGNDWVLVLDDASKKFAAPGAR